jgi:voltage-gated potassium channel Kch
MVTASADGEGFGPASPNLSSMPRSERAHERQKRFWERLNVRRAVWTVVSVYLALMFAAAWAERLVEPETFTSYGRSLWWAVVTIATVGYGDIVPQTAGGRSIAALFIIMTIGLVPVLTSLIASVLILKRTHAQSEEDAARDQALQDEVVALLKGVQARLDRIERASGL